MGYIGSRVRRTEDPRLVQGLGRYAGDIHVPGMLHAGFVRSPHARARIESIDLSGVRQIRGVVDAFSARELPELTRAAAATAWQPGAAAKGVRPLACDEVRFVGEPVAVVLAEDPASLADALDAAVIDFEPLSPVTRMKAAAAGQPLVWLDVPRNIAGTIDVGFGDVEAAFRAADVVVRGRFTLERAAPAALEPRAMVVAPGGEGETVLTIWDSTQAPHGVRDSVAAYLDLDPESVRVITPDVGGGFGPKGRTYQEEYVLAAVALRLHRPVRWVADRTEDLQTTAHGRGQVHDAQLAARRDGTILAIRDHFTQDLGAYAPMGLGAASNTTRHLLGPYRVPAADIRATGVYTNRVMTSPLRGGGRPEGIFVMERLMDRLAARLGMDRAEVRRRNLIPPESFPYDTGLVGPRGTVVYDSGDYPRCLQRALELIGYDRFGSERDEARRSGRYLGIGLACFVESTGVGSEGARIELREDGTAAVAVGSPSNGQGHATTFAQLTAERLGIPIDAVSFTSGDTRAFGWGTGTFASRMGAFGGNAVSGAAHRLRRKILALAADLLEIAPDDLVLDGGVVSVKGVPSRRLTLAAVAQAAARREIELVAEEAFQPEHQSSWASGTNAAVVEVDVETGKVTILRYVVVHDAGTIVNPTVVEGQIHGGVAHGIGNALYEACMYDGGGQLRTATLADYTIPAAGDLPEIVIEHVETPSPFNPEGIKGAGEGGTIAAIPTVVSAVEDALASFGVVLDDVPIRLAAIVMAQAPARVDPASALAASV